MNYKTVQTLLKEASNKEKAHHLQRFFKTGPGQYGEGDQFRGINVPEQRRIAKLALNLPLLDIEQLIQSPWHEDRLTGLLILVEQYQKASSLEQKTIAEWYLGHSRNINNWDLVDLSAPKIIGHYCLENKQDKVLLKLAKSSDLWEQRIAIVGTYTYIRAKNFALTLAISDALLQHKHDLIHKAVGWMLREVGKKDEVVLKQYLLPLYKTMPRTMLRYAIERFAEVERQGYLKGLV